MKSFTIKKGEKEKHFISCFYHEPDLCVCGRERVWSEAKDRGLGKRKWGGGWNEGAGRERESTHLKPGTYSVD